MSCSSVPCRRATLWSILLVSLLSIVPSCGPASAPSDTTGSRPLKIQLNWFPEPQFGGLYAARESGAFSRRGLDVELLAGSADVPGPQLLAAGQVDAAVVSASQLLNLRASGGRVVAISAAFQKAPRILIVPGDSTVDSIEALWRSEGRLMAGDGLAYLRWLDSRFGPSPLVRVPYTGSLAPFLAGEVTAMQGFAAAEPVQFEIEGIDTKIFPVADTGFNPYDGVLAIREKMLEEEPEIVAALAEAVAEGWDRYLDDPAPVNRVIAGLNPDFTDRMLASASAMLPGYMRSAATDQHRFGWMSEERWSTLADQLRDLGELDADGHAALGRVFVNPGSIRTDDGEAG